MMLQTILFGSYTPPDTPSRKHYMDGRKPSSQCGAQPDPKSVASRMEKLLKGHKWWLVPELAEHLQTSVGTIHSAIARHQRKLNVESNRFHNGKAMVKEYRIAP